MSETVGQIYTLIPKIMKEVGAISKNRQADAGGARYRFRGIDDVYNALQGPLADHGVFFMPRVTGKEVREGTTKSGTATKHVILNVDFDFYAPDGSKLTGSTVGEATDTSDKACNKAMSAAVKYVLFQVFCIATEEDKDSENDHIETVTTKKSTAVESYAAKFLDEIDKAMDERGFKSAKGYALVKINGMAMQRFKIKTIEGITREGGESIIAALKAGKMDNLKDEYTKEQEAKKGQAA